MKQSYKKAFTIVELIVVITILAILGTIGFISFSSHLVGTRDTNRLSQLASLYNGLEIYSTNNDLPMPENSVEVRASGSIIGYQGYIGKNTLGLVGYNKGGKDPKDEQYFTYYISNDKNNYQLMAYLEDKSNLQIVQRYGKIQKVNAIDYTKRYPMVYGKKLGILVQADSNIPIQEVSSIVLSGYLDIVNTNSNYKEIFTDNESITGTGKVLRGGIVGGGLVGYWSFDEIENSTFIDYSDNKAVGTLSGGITLVSGKSGKAANFDGINGEFNVNLIKDLGGNKSSPHTIIAWLNVNSIPSCSDNICRQWIILLGNTPGAGTHHWLIGGIDGPSQFGIRNGPQKVVTFTPGTWQQIAMVFDGNNIKLYVNGILTNDNSNETSRTSMNIDNSKLTLGYKYSGAFYKGYMDELRIYNRALTKKEINLIYNMEK